MTEYDESMDGRHKAVIEELLAGSSQAAAARVAGVCRQTVARWQTSHEAFRAALDTGRRSAWNDSQRRMEGLRTKAIDKLSKLLDSKSEKTQMEAIKAILRSLDETEDIWADADSLEAKFRSMEYDEVKRAFSDAVGQQWNKG